MRAVSFDTERYYSNQVEEFSKRIGDGTVQVIEFGGKPFGDYHASRVLPGYEPDIKGRILKELSQSLGNVTITLALHAQDVIAPPDGRRINQRIRGDSGLRYDDEVLRLTEEARNRFKLPIESVTLTSLPATISAENQEYIDMYTERLKEHDLDVSVINRIPGYPHLDPESVDQTLTQFKPVSEADQHIIVASPGGGSGKFSVAVTEIAHKLKAGQNPNFTKFETFPVFNLEQNHPLNVAFLAATADLPNELSVTLSGKTNYDKDVENLSILKSLIKKYPHVDSPLRNYREPTDMGVNVIETGITDDDAIKEACFQEIKRRIERYSKEFSSGDESYDTVTRTTGYLDAMANSDVLQYES